MPGHKLTPEAREAARERIMRTKPWERSTGPRTEAGKQISCMNALRHGCRSQNPYLRAAGRVLLNEFEYEKAVMLLRPIFQEELRQLDA